MQYSIFINQVKSLEWGINTQQAILFGFLHNAASWAFSSVVDGVTYYSLSKSKICTELPLLTDKPDTVYRMLKDLAVRGLILTTVINNRTYVAITKKGATWATSAPYETPEKEVGKKSEAPQKRAEKAGEKSEHVGKLSEKIGEKSALSDNQYQSTKSDNQDNKLNTSDVSPVDSIFNHWKARMNHPRARLDDKRKKLIRAALKLGYSETELITAVNGCAKSPYHMAQDGRNTTVYDDIELILRDAKHIDQFLKINSMPPAPMANQPKFDPLAYVNRGAVQTPDTSVVDFQSGQQVKQLGAA